MSEEDLLRLAYTANIAILLPVCGSLFLSQTRGGVAAFEYRTPESAGLRLLCASLWSGVLICSLAGWLQPKLFVALLAFQVVYKSVFLVSYVLPRALTGRSEQIPRGITWSFALIVIFYSLILRQIGWPTPG